MLTLGQKIKHLREARGISRKDFADQLDVAQATVSRWEADIGTPRLFAACDIADVLNVSLDCLMQRS